MRAGQADWLFRKERISVKVLPWTLICASTEISSPGVSGTGKLASGLPPNSWARRARAPVRPAFMSVAGSVLVYSLRLSAQAKSSGAFGPATIAP
jgi:hypothetical protein